MIDKPDNDLWGKPIAPPSRGPLADRFLMPPFSVLNAREGDWQERKRAWIALGIESEVGRAGALMMSNQSGLLAIQRGTEKTDAAADDSALASGTSIFDPVLCELEAGIGQLAKPADTRRRLTILLRHVRLWPVDAETARLYGEVFNELRRLGRALSQVDMMTAALARQHKLTVLTTDRDFEALADVRTENWTTPP